MYDLYKADSSVPNHKPVELKGAGTDVLLLGALYLLEFSLLLIILTAYVFSRKPSLISFLFSRPGYLFMAGVLGIVLSGVMVAHRYVQTYRTKTRTFKIIVAMNLISVFLLFSVGEGTVRAFYKKTPTGAVWGKTYLLPREWDEVVDQFQEYFRSTLGKSPYYVFHDVLGWTIAPNRSREGESFFSSAEGLRSPRIGMAFADRRAATRIALIGDSYTFADEVSFEESWGHQLEMLLGPDVQVLNFGVNGYGTDQAYLRYVHHVRSWNPDVVIFGFVDHDLVRTMGVYCFLTFPNATTPFATPRFVINDEKLTLLNTPLPSPEQIFSARSIGELPYTNWDRGYVEGEWDRPAWTHLTRSYLFRWLETWYPLSEEPRPEVSDAEMQAVNRTIFQSFVSQVRADGAIPMLAYLPTWMQDTVDPDYKPLSVKILREAGLKHIDLTSCFSQIPIRDRVMPRRHYSPRGNHAVALCLREAVAHHLDNRSN